MYPRKILVGKPRRFREVTTGRNAVVFEVAPDRLLSRLRTLADKIKNGRRLTALDRDVLRLADCLAEPQSFPGIFQKWEQGLQVQDQPLSEPDKHQISMIAARLGRVKLDRPKPKKRKK